MRDIAWNFVHSTEASSLFNAMSNTQFADCLYKTGLGRQGSDAEVPAWARRIAVLSAVPMRS